MNKYLPKIYDVVTLLEYYGSDNLRDIEVVLKEEYMVSYVFGDGGMVIYREIDRGHAVYAEEFVIEQEDVKHFSFLYSYLDNANVTVKFSNTEEEVANAFYEAFDLSHPDNYISDSPPVDVGKPNFKVGDYVYSNCIELIKMHDIMELENNVAYKIKSFNVYGTMFIETKHGDFEIYKNEVKYFKLCDEEFEEEQMWEIEEMLDELLVENLPNLIQIEIDKLLDMMYDNTISNKDFERLEELSELLKQLEEKRS